MAVYDPLRPQVIGPQWSPVRQESIPFDLGTELGYTFSITGSPASGIDGRWSVSHFPTTLVQGQTPFISIYRKGEEVNVGRVYRAVIELNTAAVTGASVSGTASVATALKDPWDARFVALNSGNSAIQMTFDTAVPAVANALTGRRILKVNLLYTAWGPFSELDNSTNGVYASIESVSDVWPMGLGSISGPLNISDTVPIGRVSFGDVNPFWNSGGNPFTEPLRYPWRYEELLNFSPGATATQLYIGIHGLELPATTKTVNIGYAALEVFFCEENREWYGGKSMGNLPSFPSAFATFDVLNTITLKTSSFQTTGGLSQGDYTVTLTLADSGDTYNRGDRASFPALREAESLPLAGPQGVLITKWQDPDGLTEFPDLQQQGAQYNFSGNPPSITTSNILPSISLLNAGLTTHLDSTADHSYGVQIQANVLDNTTATQTVIQNANSAQVSYPWVRYYARRFGTNSRTLKLSSDANPNVSVTIDQDTFDALPEIINGWREVTLRFTSATPSFSNDGSLSSWSWSTVNGSVSSENKWEILGAYNLDTASLPNTTYGSNVAFSTFNDMTNALGTETANGSTDLMLMFSQDPIAVSGLAVTTLSQEVTGIGLECSTLPECVPTGIAYNHVSWSADNIVCDTFSREVTGGWDGTDTGQTYTTSGGAASDYAVTDGVGTLTIASGTGSRRTVLSGMTQTDPDLYATFAINQTPIGSALTLGFTARGTDTSNQYVLSARCNTDGTITALIERVIAGSFVNIGSGTVPNVSFFADQQYNLRARLEGTSLKLRIWEHDTVEPTIWHATATDATYTSGTVSGFRANVAAGYTGTYPVVFSVDNFMTSEVTVVGSTYELQRSDDVDTDWQTIMVSSDLCPVDFEDYEARVGVVSYYRIRLVNALRFPGQWSSTVSATLTEPGVFGVGDGNSVLIFTTNEIQSGARNLAYSMSWDRNPEEGFTFPEADSVQLQPLYQRDFVVAFRPTERGGEQFSRTLLVNNAAVSTERIRDGFRSLRDMAWEDVSYICVRNELGDRWFATVLVPSGSIQRNRKLYLAQVDIIEVTSTPSTVIIPNFIDGES